MDTYDAGAVFLGVAMGLALLSYLNYEKSKRLSRQSLENWQKSAEYCQQMRGELTQLQEKNQHEQSFWATERLN